MSLPEFSSPDLIGIPIKQVCSFHSIAVKYNNQELLCHVVNGHPATFNLVDLQTKTILFRNSMIGAESSWQLIRYKDTIYIAGTGDSGRSGHLFSYNLASGDFREHGVVCEGEKFLWSMATDNMRYVYIGTWPNGKIIQFDTTEGTFTDFGTIVAGQNYLRTLTYLDGFLYAGTGPKGALVKIDPHSFNPKTGYLDKIYLEKPVYDLLKIDSLPFCYEIASASPYLLVFFDSEKKDLLTYNTRTNTWKHLTDGYKAMMLETDNGEVFYTTKDGLFCFTGSNGTSTLVSSKCKTTLRGGGVIGDVIYSVFFNGSIFSFDTKKELATTDTSPCEGASTQIQTIFRGPDDNLYFSGYPGGTGAQYNPKTNEITRFPLEQAEGMGFLGTEIYFGVYPHARIYKMETTKPLDPKKHPEMVWQIHEKQDRPFVVTCAENLVYFGTIPTYGYLGGGISIFDPKTNSGDTYAPIIPGHSVTSLLYHHGFLYGGTSIWGGLGIEPTVKHALMFKWDVKQRKLVNTFLPLKEAEEAPMISGLCEIDGLIYGNFNGIIFAWDPVKEQTVKYRNLYPEVKRFGRWRPTFNYYGTDGLLYSSVAAYVTAIEPDTLNYRTIAHSDLFTLGKDNTVYIVKGWQLYKTKACESAYDDVYNIQG